MTRSTCGGSYLTSYTWDSCPWANPKHTLGVRPGSLGGWFS